MTTGGMVTIVVIALVFFHYSNKQDARKREQKSKQIQEEQEQRKREQEEREREREWEALPEKIKVQKIEERKARALASLSEMMEKREKRRKETEDSFKLLILEFEDMGISQTMLKDVRKLPVATQEYYLGSWKFSSKDNYLVEKITDLDVEELFLILDKAIRPWKYENHPIYMEDYIKRQYFKSDDWHNLKLKRLKLSNNQCEAENCFNIKNLELHHRWYSNLGNEDIDDVRIVCRQCHQAVHDKYGYDKTEYFPI